MSMTAALPMTSLRTRRSSYAWEVAKIVFAVVTFTALLLPVAFPSKADTRPSIARVSTADPASSFTGAESARSGIPLPARRPALRNG